MSDFVPLSIKEILQLYPDDISNDNVIKNIKHDINQELRKIHYNNKDMKAYKNIKRIIHSTSNNQGKSKWNIIKYNVDCLILNLFKISYLELRPLSSDEFDKLFRLATYRKNYINTTIKIEYILKKIFLDKDCENFLTHINDNLEDYENIRGYILEIASILNSNGKTEKKLINEVKSIVVNYFNTQKIKTFGIKKTLNILAHISENDNSYFPYLNYIQIKRDLDNILVKISKDEDFNKLIEKRPSYNLFFEQIKNSSFNNDIAKIISNLNFDVCLSYIYLEFYDILA